MEYSNIYTVFAENVLTSGLQASFLWSLYTFS